MVVVILIFGGHFILTSMVATLIYFLPTEYKGSCFPMFSPALAALCFLDDSHSDRIKM
jgi:hypothetical protein